MITCSMNKYMAQMTLDVECLITWIKSKSNGNHEEYACRRFAYSNRVALCWFCMADSLGDMSKFIISDVDCIWHFLLLLADMLCDADAFPCTEKPIDFCMWKIADAVILCPSIVDCNVMERNELSRNMQAETLSTNPSSDSAHRFYNVAKTISYSSTTQSRLMLNKYSLCTIKQTAFFIPPNRLPHKINVFNFVGCRSLHHRTAYQCGRTITAEAAAASTTILMDEN